MHTTFVTVDGQEFCLGNGQSVTAAKELILSAVRRGGGLVEFVVASGIAVGVLVAPGIGVQFREEEVVAEAVPVAVGLSYADFDQY